ncbi:MAG: hypothetical protein HZC40_00110 [Chloroflexi bacterium]|nr:hypothetical protein [Chloroflexota bacterium]
MNESQTLKFVPRFWNFSTFPFSSFDRLAKRAFDIVAAFAGLIALAPFLLLVVLLPSAKAPE